jgi:hypothetical protein
MKISDVDADWIDGLYASEFWPENMAQAYRDFEGFMHLRWLTLDDKPRFLRVMRQRLDTGDAQ